VTRVRVGAVLLVLLVALGALLVAGAAAVTPDLSKMTIQASDLQPGATVGTNGYQATPTGFTALFERDFAGAQTAPRGLRFALRTQILLAPSSSLAGVELRDEHRLFGSARGRRLLTSAILAGAGPGVTAKQVHFGKISALGVGVGSFEERVTVRALARVATAEFAVIGTGTVVASLAVVARVGRVPGPIMTTLAGDVVSHVTSVLAGATGPTGATGAT